MAFNKKQELHDLVKSDKNIALVRKLLARGADPNRQNPFGETPLHIASKSAEDNIKIVKKLIKAGADPDRRNCLSHKPLHIAVIYRNRKAVKTLLKFTTDINSKDIFKKTALHYAVNKSPPNIVLLPDIPLRAHVVDMWIVRKLLSHKGINVSRKDKSLETPLMQAVRDKHKEIVKLLIKSDSKLEYSNQHGLTPLHIALSHKDPCPRIVVLLLLKRVSLLKMNLFNETPLNLIINSKSFDFACICLKVIAFNYDIDRLLMNKVSRVPELRQFLSTCYNEINAMKLDIIANELTVFDFIRKWAPKINPILNPVLQIYKPVVERIINGLYPEYFFYILFSISKSNMYKVLKATIDETYCDMNCDVKNCKKEHPTLFTEIVKVKQVSDYLSILDIFYLIKIISKDRYAKYSKA